MSLPTRHVSVSASNKITKFTNCYMLLNHQIIREDLWVSKGKIINPEVIFYKDKRTPDSIIDCAGALIAPGFIDLQINGGFGVDFTFSGEKIDEAITTVGKGILAHGVTSFCPTLVSSSSDVYKTILPRLRKRTGGVEGASVLGAHLEGPFISKERKGAHDEEVIQSSFRKGFQSIKEMFGPIGNVILFTLAPELPNALDVIEALTNEKVIVSIGHSSANYDVGEKALQKGATFITHLFNAMVPFHHRDPGLIGLMCAPFPEMKFGLISDGIHTHSAAIRVAHQANPEAVVLTTDAISAYGLPSGTHKLGRLTVDIKEGSAYLSGTDILCGSIKGMIDCVKVFKEASGCTLPQALEAASLHPAQVVKMERLKGTLNYGSDADFILLNQDLVVLQTYISGRKVYVNPKCVDLTFEYKYEETDEKRLLSSQVDKSKSTYCDPDKIFQL